MRILLTGSTGYIGAEIGLALLAAGHSCQLLVRPSSVGRAEQLFSLHRQRGAISILPIDLADGSAEFRAAASGPPIDAAVHLAALAQFEGYRLETFRRANVEGSRRALELAAAKGAREFFHFSTAFVCGDYPGEFRESDSNAGQNFRNDYERTKLEGELALAEAAHQLGVGLTILRPSIVTGDGAAGRGRGLFGVIEILEWLKARLDRDPEARRVFAPLLPGDPSLRLNIISLQAVVALFARIFENSRLWGGRYHLVNPSYTKLERVKASLEDLMEIRTVRLEGEPGAKEREDREPSPLEKVFRRRLNPYLPYFKSAPRWNCDRLANAVPDWRKLCMDASAGGLLEPAAAGADPWIDGYFRRFIPSRIHDSAFGEVRSLNDVTAVTIDGEIPLRYLLRFRSGAFELLDPPAEFPSRCHFRLGREAFRSIVSGEVPPQQAFFSKRVKIMGDVFFALKLGSLLEGFFLRNPYREETCGVAARA